MSGGERVEKPRQTCPNLNTESARNKLTFRKAPTPSHQPAPPKPSDDQPFLRRAGARRSAPLPCCTSLPQAPPPGTGGPPRHTHTPLPFPSGTPPLLTIWLMELGKGCGPELSPGREKGTYSLPESGAGERREGPPRVRLRGPLLPPPPRTFQCICSRGGGWKGVGKARPRRPAGAGLRPAAHSLQPPPAARSLAGAGGSAARGRQAPEQMLLKMADSSPHQLQPLGLQRGLTSGPHPHP